MKVFISWSGDTSHRVAKIFRDWLPSVIQSVTPYVSSEDIDKGSRWSTDIAGELDESTYGILCVTRENLDAPWLNFEAGALGKSVEKSRVSPFLYQLKRSEIKGPILQFQSTIQDRDDVFKLIKSINQACGELGLDEARLEKVFDVWWPSLEQDLNSVPTPEVEREVKPNNKAKKTPEFDQISNILEEVLEISRTNQKLLRNPEEILPPDYFDYLFERSSSAKNRNRTQKNTDIHPDAIRDSVICYRDVLKCVIDLKNSGLEVPGIEEIHYLLRKMDEPMRYMSSNIGMRLPRDLLDDEKF
ncbi:toll/interleukin-1 receptor domain-containing protein [Vibrio fluvialis]|nr:toll/interleukin-1 receptor domain-containing protein [Vibrio fluvialis]ELX9691134.1 toll/interleukin-1 receptor domain-containing protein [Vibrio fluvialis]